MNSSAPRVMPEVFLVESTRVVRLKDGRVVKRITYTNGSTNDIAVFPGDYPDAPLADD